MGDFQAGVVTCAMYLVLAALLLGATSRWVRRLERGVLVALLLLPLAFTGKALITGQVYAPFDLAYNSAVLRPHSDLLPQGHEKNPILSDVHCQNIPFRKAVHHAFHSGQWPLWNPFVGAGEPLLGTAQAAPFSLLTVASLLVPFANGFTLTAALHYLLAVVGGFLLARELGCRDPGAVIAGVAWAFSNFQVFWSGWTLGQSFALLPWVVVAARRCVTRPGWSSVALLGSAASLLLHAGHPETGLHMAGILAIVLLFELSAIARHRWLPALASLAGGTLLAAMLSAVYVLPVLDTIIQTSEWVSRAEHHSWAAPDLEYAREALLADLLPFAQGFTKTGLATHRSLYWIPGDSSYVGSMLLVPALFGLLRGRRRWLLPTLLALGLLAGAKAPPIQNILASLPLFGVTLNTRLVAIAALATSVAAGLGFDQAMRRVDLQRRMALAQVSASIAALVLVASLWRWMESAGVAPSELLRQSLPYVLGPLATAGVLWRVRRGSLMVALTVLLLVCTRYVEIGWFYPSLPRAAFYPEVPPFDALPKDGPVYRVAPVGYSVVANEGILFGIEDPRVYNAIHHRNGYRLASHWSTTSIWFNRIDDLRSPLLSFLNVEYAVAPRPFPRPPGWRRVDNAEEVKLLRNRGSLDRAFVPRRVVFEASPEAVYENVRDAADLAEVAWVELELGSSEALPDVLQDPEGATVVTFREGTENRIEATLPEDTWLVVSNVDWRGWRAVSDVAGELEVVRANSAFLALEVPAGRHQIRLWFRPRSFDVGLVVSLLGVLGLAGISLTGLWRGRLSGGE